MKTIQQYLEELPHPIKDFALQNLRPSFAGEKVDSMHAAIGLAFDWEKVEFGFDFWAKVQDSYPREPANDDAFFITCQSDEGKERQTRKKQVEQLNGFDYLSSMPY